MSRTLAAATLALVVAAPVGAAAADLDGRWQLGKRYRYEYRIEGKAVGNETFWFERAEDGALRLRDEAEIAAPPTRLTAVAQIEFDASGLPLRATRRQDVKADVPGQSGLFEMTFAFGADAVKAVIRRDEAPFWEGEVRVKPRRHAFDNNFLGALAYALGKTGVGEGETLQLFHMGSTRVLALKLGPARTRIAKVAGRAMTVHESPFELDGAPTGTVAFDERRRLVLYTQGESLRVVLAGR